MKRGMIVVKAKIRNARVAYHDSSLSMSATLIPVIKTVSR